MVDEAPNALRFHFDYQQPILAIDLADLFRSASLDYRRFSRTDLVVADIRLGSIDIWFKPLVETVGTVASLWDFAQALKNGAEYLLGTGEGGSEQAADSTSKTLDSLANLIEKTNGRANVRYRDKNRKIKLDIDVPGAHQIKSASSERRERKKTERALIAREDRPQLMAPPKQIAGPVSMEAGSQRLAGAEISAIEERQLLVWTEPPRPEVQLPGQGVIASISPDPKWIVGNQDMEQMFNAPIVMDFAYVVDAHPLIAPEGVIGYLIVSVLDRVPRRPPPSA